MAKYTLNANEFEMNDKEVSYQATDHEKKLINYVMSRFSDMESSRTAVDKDWDLYQQMIEARYEPYPDERSSSVVPLIQALWELFVAECLKLKPSYNFRWETTKYKQQAKALEYVWKYDWRKNNRVKVFNENDYITARFWTSVIFSGFESCRKTQKDFTVDDNWNYTFKNVSYVDEKIITKNVDIRHFYVDDQAINCFDEAIDCIYKQQISFERFKEFKNSPVYKNVDKVAPQGYSLDYFRYTTIEDTVKQWKFVELIHYFNVEKDAYIVLANWVVVREQPLPYTMNWRKALPFTMRVLAKRQHSIYWKGFCEAALMFNSEINNLREMLMDAIRRSNQQVIAIWNWLKFDWRAFSYDNEILTFDWNLANNFQQITWTPPNQAIFSYLEQVYKDIAIFIGIDIQNIMGQPQQTAFQTEVQREASQKRINVWLFNRDTAFERFANLHKDLLQIYFPRKTAEWVYPEIETKDEEFVNWKFKKKRGKHLFQVTPETIRWDIYVDVYTNANATTINAVDKQQKIDMLNAIWQIAQWYQVAQQTGADMDKILPFQDAIRDIADMHNIQPITNDVDNEDLRNRKWEIMEELKSMMSLWKQQPLQNPNEWLEWLTEQQPQQQQQQMQQS